MRRHLLILLLSYVAVCSFWSGNAHCSSVAILDQSLIPKLEHATGFGQNLNAPAQTFTVGITGMLTRIDVAADVYSLYTDMNVQLMGTSGGVPDPTKLLASTLIPGEALIPISGWGQVPRTPIDFSSFGTRVNSGDQLAIALHPVNPSPSAGIKWYDVLASYAGGAAYWWHADLSIFVQTYGKTLDFGFATYVIPVPEPASFGLFITAGLLLACRPRQAR